MKVSLANSGGLAIISVASATKRKKERLGQTQAMGGGLPKIENRTFRSIVGPGGTHHGSMAASLQSGRKFDQISLPKEKAPINQFLLGDFQLHSWRKGAPSGSKQI